VCHADQVTSPDTGSDLSLDEIVERSGLSARTIRYYQSEGILPSPRKVGRDAVYSVAHVERLDQIAELQARGLKIEAIKQLLGRKRDHRSVTEWLGVDDVLRARWADDEAAVMTRADVHGLLGRHPHRIVGEMVEAGLLDRRDDGTFVAPSRALLDLSLRMLDAGVSIDVGSRAAVLLRKRLSKAADDLVELFASETGRSFAGKGKPDELAAAIDAVRPIALDAARLILAQEFERSLRVLASKPQRNR
jgi:DNA-binding transcriptional MerR regulator